MTSCSEIKDKKLDLDLGLGLDKEATKCTMHFIKKRDYYGGESGREILLLFSWQTKSKIFSVICSFVVQIDTTSSYSFTPYRSNILMMMRHLLNLQLYKLIIGEGKI